MILKTLAMVAATVVSGVVFAGVERNFVGTTGGEFGVAANWSGSTLPGDGDTAIIPNGVTVNVSSSDSVAALKAVSFLKLNGSTAKLSIVGQSVDFDGGKPQLLGAGVFSAEATSGTSVAINLRQNNSDYTGSFSFKGVTTYAFGPKTVGGANACPISQTMLDNGDVFHFAEKGNYYGPVALDAAKTWQGLAADATVTGVITNFGALTVSVGAWNGGARFSQNSAYDFVQRGKIAMATSGRFDINVNKAGRLWLDCEAEFKNADDDFFADTATIGTIVLGPNFCLKKGRMQTNGGNGFFLEGENPFTRAGGCKVNFLLSSATATFDLNGHDFEAPGYFFTKAGSKITSGSGPATFKLTGNFNTTGAALNSDLNGHVSFEMATANASKIVTQSGSSSQTDGAIIVSKGTLTLDASVNMPKLRGIVLGVDGGDDAAKLDIPVTGFTLNSGLKLRRYGVGRLGLASGVTLTVSMAFENDNSMDPGKYSGVAADGVKYVDWIDGAGILEVATGGIKKGDYVWSGAATGGSWSDAANWTVDGAAASRSPGNGDRAVIEGAAEVVVGDDEAASFNALAGLVLLDAESVVTIANRTTAPQLSFPISGAGRLRAVDVGYVSDSVQPAFDLVVSGDNSAFVGEFFFTNTSVSVESVKAFSKTSRVTFWGWFSYASSYSKTHLPMLKWRTPGVYENKLFVYGGGMGVLAAYCDGGVTNLGDLVYWNMMSSWQGSTVRAQTYNATGGTGGYLAFGGKISCINPNTGKIDTSGGINLDLNGNVEIFGNDAIELTAYQMVYSDNGSIVWGKPINVMKQMECYPQLKFTRANVDANSALPLVVRCDQNITVDLNGCDQEFKSFACSGTLTANRKFSIKSDSPARLTFKHSSASELHTTLDGAVSLCLDGAGDDVLALTTANGGISSTTGGLAVAGGVMTLNSTVRMPNLSSIQVGKSDSDVPARLTVASSSVVLNPAKARECQMDLELAGVGCLDLPAGSVLKVRNFTVNGKKQGAGTYGSGNFPGRINGSGVVRVVGGGLFLIVK